MHTKIFIVWGRPNIYHNAGNLYINGHLYDDILTL